MKRAKLNKMADALQQGVEHIEANPDPLQPTVNFLDHANRDVRRHFCIFTNTEGKSFFLRPDFTLPICLEHARSSLSEARYFYVGDVWLWNAEGSRPQQQAQMGIEHIGTPNINQTIADVINATHQALIVGGVARPFLRMGDPALFDRLVNLLDLPDDWRVRLQKLFRRNAGLALFFQQAKQAMTHRVNNRAEIECRSVEELKVFLQKNDITHIGQRSLNEIVERLEEQNALHHPALPERTMEVIKNFLNLPDAYPEVALENIQGLAKKHGLDFDDALATMALSWQKMKASPLSEILTPDNVSFSTHFQGAHLHYYTGFVFSFLETREGALPLAGGGQYSGLLRAIDKIQSSGFGATIYLDELTDV